MYRRVEIKDGESIEPVQFVAVHPLRWPAGLVPQAAFVEADGIDAKLAAAEGLAKAGEKAENALEVLTDGPGYPIGYDEADDTRIQMARASLRELSAALRQYREAK